MKSIKPIVKFNNGNPIALCNRCFSIMCYVSCYIEDLDFDGDCVVIEQCIRGNKLITTTPIGHKPPIYCDDCKKLLQGYSLNE